MFLTAALVAAALQSGTPTVWYVDAQAAPSFGSGTAADPWVSISYAVQQTAVQSGDVLLVAPGDYLNEAVDLDGKALTIQSTEGPGVTRLYARPPGLGTTVSLFRIDDGEAPVTIEGFGLTGGSGAPNCTQQTEPVGGALSICGASTVLVRNCTFVGNTATRGGSVYVRDATLDLEDCVFEGPGSDVLGEALYCRDANVRIDGCTFRDLRIAPQGFAAGQSAVVIEHSTARIVDSTFTRNATALFGAHLWCRNADVDVQRTVFDTSTGYAGSGLAVLGGSLVLQASVVANARSISSPGAGLFASNASIALDRCAFVDNEVVGNREGGGIALQNSDLVVRSSTFLRNTASRGGGIDVGSLSTARVLGSHFEGNHTTFQGSAIASAAGALFVDDCVLVANDAGMHAQGSTIAGGGTVQHSTLYRNIAGNAAIDGDFDVTASIVWRNLPIDVNTSGALVDSIIGVYVAPPDAVVGVTGGDPLFWGPTDVDLLPDSPGVDALSPAYGFDPDGSRREIGARTFDPFACGEGCAGPLGDVGCTGAVNSTGSAADLVAFGSASILDDRLVLAGTDFPTAKSAVIVAAPQPGAQPLPGTAGQLCLAGTIHRYEGTFRTRPDGTFAARVPLGAGPLLGAFGETWHFQVWFRDDVPPHGAALSSSLALSLE